MENITYHVCVCKSYMSLNKLLNPSLCHHQGTRLELMNGVNICNYIFIPSSAPVSVSVSTRVDYSLE